MEEWAEEGQTCQLSVADLSKISKMSGVQWREERKRRISERIFGKRPKIDDDDNRSPTPQPGDETEVETRRFIQQGGNRYTMGMTGDKLKERMEKESKDLKNQVELHAKLRGYIKKEATERPANMSAVLQELEGIVQKGGTLSKERANEIVIKLRSRLPKDHFMFVFFVFFYLK